MTTTVRVLIEGNKSCSVQVVGGQFPTTTPPVKPGEWTTRLISGTESVTVTEVEQIDPPR